MDSNLSVPCVSQEERDPVEVILWPRGFAVSRLWPIGLSSPDLQDNGMRWPKSEPKWDWWWQDVWLQRRGLTSDSQTFPHRFQKGFSKISNLPFYWGKKGNRLFFFIYTRTPEIPPLSREAPIAPTNRVFIILSKWIKIECHLVNATFPDLT